MDFVSDELFNGRRIRALPILAFCSQECLTLFAAHNIRGAPYSIQVKLDFSRRGKPTDNAFVIGSTAFSGRMP